jgi:putative SOS response-associated peptidase YedK
MCGRYVMPDDEAIGEYWAISCRIWLPTLLPRFNVAPTAQVPLLVRNGAGALEPRTARWGLIPSWWHKDKPPASTFNARSEDAAQKPTWRDSLKSARGLMPARGWYEWNPNEPALDAAGREGKQPYFLFCPQDPVIAFAALWSLWERPGAAPVLSCALLSRKAAPAIAAIHPRMPAVLKPEHFSRWLDPATPPETVLALIADARQDLAAHPVGPRVNDARNDGPELMVTRQGPSTGGQAASPYPAYRRSGR